MTDAPASNDSTQSRARSYTARFRWLWLGPMAERTIGVVSAGRSTSTAIASGLAVTVMSMATPERPVAVHLTAWVRAPFESPVTVRISGAAAASLLPTVPTATSRPS